MQVSKILFLTVVLLCSNVIGSSLHTGVAAAETAIGTANQAEQTLRIDALEKSWIRVTVDDKLVFIGRLRPPSTRQWVGQSFIVKTDNAAGIAINVNGSPAEILDTSDKSMTFSWPDTLTTTDDPPATGEPTATEDPASDSSVADAKAAEAPTGEINASEALTDTGRLEDEDPQAEPPAAEEQPLETISYLVKPGDSLTSIGERFGVTMSTLVQLNNITDVNLIAVGSTLVVPVARNRSGSAAEDALAGDDLPDPRGTVLERLTLHSQAGRRTSPYYKTTWLTYYGRPNVPIMGILGEYTLDQLTPLLRAQARAYDDANGPELDVTPAYHLVYGMATRASGRDGSHLVFLGEDTTMVYIERAAEEDFEVILDVQIGALSPVDAMSLAFPMLQHDNVHLGLDPEFAMSHPNQYIPGAPPGFVTAQQVNEVQAAMQAYMEENKIKGERVLLLHQFLATMIVNKEELDYSYDKIALTISVDGWGPPDGKIVKYNRFIAESAKYSAFKLFYGWDRPLMSERQAMGVDSVNDGAYYVETTPNLIIYQ